MSKKCVFLRQLKRTKKISINRNKKNFLFKNRVTMKFNSRLINRDSCKTRLRNRCPISGRARGYYRFFGVSRIFIRRLSFDINIPGILKASW
ncbi:30S ribosomal protein S14 [Candidatus Vidania fulgoroideorum]